MSWAGMFDIRSIHGPHATCRHDSSFSGGHAETLWPSLRAIFQKSFVLAHLSEKGPMVWSL